MERKIMEKRTIDLITATLIALDELPPEMSEQMLASMVCVYCEEKKKNIIDLCAKFVLAYHAVKE